MVPVVWVAVLVVGTALVSVLGTLGVVSVIGLKELDQVGDMELKPTPAYLRELYGPVADDGPEADDYEDGDLDLEQDEEWHRQLENARTANPDAPDWWVHVPEDRT